MFIIKIYNFSKKSKKYVHVILSIYLLVLILINNSYINLNSLLLVFYFIAPLILLCFYSSKIEKCKIKHKEDMLFTVVIYSIMYIIVYFGSGFILGYGKSPYNTTFLGVLYNLLFFGLPIISIEICRYYLINMLKMKKNKMLCYTGITMLCIVCKLNFNVITNISNLKMLVEYTSQMFLPCISRNILATYLTSTLGIIPACIYMFIVEFIEFIPPVLPNLQWLTRGVINISLPIFTYIGVSLKYNRLSKNFKEYKRPKENIFSWVITCTISVMLIWFSTGVFSYFPSVVVTGSMIPVIKPGDVVIIDKIETEKDIKLLKKGDVIQFKRDNIMIVHRIIELVFNKEDGLTYYRTKGDNNSAIDVELVNPNDVKGTLYKVIPKLGWPTLILRNNDSINIDDVEF